MTSMVRLGFVAIAILLTAGAALHLVGVFAFLIILGGIVSYLGDLLGTYFAKRKLSLLGLRPKRTGTVISMLTGILITLATLGGAMMVSDDYKNALLHYKTLRLERNRLQKANDALTIKEEQTSLALGVADEKLKKVTQELAEAEKIRMGLNEEIEALRKDKEEKLEQIQTLAEALKKKEQGLIVITKGQELLSEPSLVPFSADRAQLSGVVTEMIGRIDKAVGAVGIEMNMPATDIIDREVVGPIWEQFVSIRDLYQKNAEREPHGIHATDCILRPIAVGNLSLGEKLHGINFDIKPNRVIYTPGEEIERMSLDGSQSEEELLKRLFFFDRQVEDRMMRKGVLPATLAQRRVQITSAMVLNFTRLIEKVKEMGGWVIVRLVAVTAIRNVGNFDASYQLVGPSQRPAEDASPSPSPDGSPDTGVE